jgi:hypothetical protein
MSNMNLDRRNGNENSNGTRNDGERVESIPPPYPPHPVLLKKPELETAQHQLGNVTLEAVDRLAGMTADEIDRVAERLLEGAQETEAVLRQLAWCVRENGLFASERLDRFVRVSNQCADIARAMQECVDRRDEQEALKPTKPEPSAEREFVELPESAVERQLFEVAAADGAPAEGVIVERIEEINKKVRTVGSRSRRRRAADRLVHVERPAAHAR